MRIDLPCCGFKNCRYCFDGNCTKPSKLEKCEYWYLLYEEAEEAESDLQPTCNNLATDTISRQVAIDAVNKIAPVNTEYDCTLLDILDVRYVLTELPSAQPEIIRCKDCKYAEVADKEDSQDGYTCQFHRGSIWFSGSYCSWAERGEECTP